MSIEHSSDTSDDAEPVRRQGDRRRTIQAVSFDRRKSDRRTTPGVTALFKTLFRRPKSGT